MLLRNIMPSDGTRSLVVRRLDDVAVALGRVVHPPRPDLVDAITNTGVGMLGNGSHGLGAGCRPRRPRTTRRIDDAWPRTRFGSVGLRCSRYGGTRNSMRRPDDPPHPSLRCFLRHLYSYILFTSFVDCCYRCFFSGVMWDPAFDHPLRGRSICLCTPSLVTAYHL